MGDPDDTAEGPTERLQAGPSRRPLFPPVPARWRQHAATLLAFALGAAAASTLLWPQDESAPPPRFRADAHDVELVLFQAVPPRSGTSPLRVEGALLLSGPVTSTILSVELLGPSFDVRAPRLPLTVSPNDRFRAVTLRISVLDCARAARWEPADRPFTLAWRDEFDRTHTDRAGDFGRSTGTALIRYIEAVCDN